MNIVVSDLKKVFGDKTVVDIPKFSIPSGEILGLVGNNGAGKTTFFRLILDLIKADGGEILFGSCGNACRLSSSDSLSCSETPSDMLESDSDSQSCLNGDGKGEMFNPAKTEAWKKFTGAYIDEGFLIDFLTPEEYFEFIGKTNNMSSDEVNERLKGFESFMGGEILGQNKYIRNFSAGNKQKIGIISALLNSPELVILDEPFNFLDPTSQNVLKKLLEDYNRDNGATILISSHNLQHTINISTRIALLEHGNIIRDIPNNNGSANAELEEYFKI